MEKAQETHKKWCDLNAREKSFEVGEKILVLLPTSTNKLLAHWQKVNKVIYQVEMQNKRKDSEISTSICCASGMNH